MAKNDWDLDDLLDFHYDREVPEKNKKVNDIENDIKLYEELRRQSKSSNAPAFDAPEPLSGHKWIDDDADIFAQYDKEHANDRYAGHRPVEEVDESAGYLHGIKEIDAIKQASQEAYDRYRSNYTKKKRSREKSRERKRAAAAGSTGAAARSSAESAANISRKSSKGSSGGSKKRPAGRKRVTGFDRVLTLLYMIAFGVFAASMIIMDVLPFGMGVALFTVLILLSLVILVQTRKRSIKKWGKRLATLLAMVMIVFYGVGTAYALGTLSFLSDTSVNNESAVSDVTKHPFNVVITGIDVDGTIEEQGRSDVNMIVTVNPSTHQILLTSIPRDYEIYMPEFDNAMDKLTHTGFYGVQTTIEAEEQLLDIEANYYVKVNFTTVERFIDAIGGVDVESEYEFNPVKMKDWTVQVGMNHMNGKQALAFARERKAFPTGDHQRIKNQQLVFEALIKKATSSRTMILSYNKVLSGLRDYFEMSFSSREIRKLVKFQLAKEPDWQIYKNTIVGGDGSLPTYSTGGAYAYVMTQDAASIENAKTLINAVMQGEELWTDEEGNVTVTQSEE